EDRGQALRRELQKVIAELGPVTQLAQDLVEEPGRVNDSDAILALIDRLGRAFRLSVAWTSEADDCWNWSCNVQELDESRVSYLDAVD
ncbi:pmp6, partial [Symbiodinium sp. KB8]